MVESKHPYDDNSNKFWEVNIPDADGGIEVRFDPQSKTEKECDYVRFYKDSSHKKMWGEEKYSGGHGGSEKNFPSISAPLLIPAKSFVVNFVSDGSENDWGFRMVASRKGGQLRRCPLTPLQTVESPELQIMLLESKADPNVADKNGDTPLHLTDSAELMAALLEHGASLEMANKVSMSVLVKAFVKSPSLLPIHDRTSHALAPPPSLSAGRPYTSTNGQDARAEAGATREGGESERGGQGRQHTSA